MSALRAIIPCVLLLCPALEALPGKRGIDAKACQPDETRIEGQFQYSSSADCGVAMTDHYDLHSTIYTMECQRQMGYARPYLVHGIYPNECFTFPNGTIRFKTDICCPKELTDQRCYSCNNALLTKDPFTNRYEHDVCNIQNVAECGVDQVCSTEYSYSTDSLGATKVTVSKGCTQKNTCNQKNSDNSLTCKTGLTSPSCTYCCNSPLCNKDTPDFPNIVPKDDSNKDDPCNINNGKPSPCLNGGGCKATAPTFQCECVNGFHGKLCEDDPCTNPYPCKDNGWCTVEPATPFYKCYCRPNQYGSNCEGDFPECTDPTCLNGGTCYDQSALSTHGKRCLCPHGYLGEFCEIKPDLKAKCSAPELYFRIDEEGRDPMAKDTTNTCTKKHDYVAEYWLGHHWIVNSCKSHLFPNFRNGIDGDLNKMDITAVGVFRCEQAHDVMYFNIDACCPACLSSPCQNDGWCTQDGDGYVCKCRHGYYGDHCQFKAVCCEVFGDPHFITFDGKLFPEQGTCKRCLVANKANSGLPDFIVYGKNEERNGVSGVSYPAYIEMEVYGVVVRIGHMGTVYIDGKSIGSSFDLTKVANDLITLQKNGQKTLMETDFGLRIEFDGEYMAEIWLPHDLHDKTECLCGNNNGKIEDDLVTKAGLNVAGDSSSYSKVANSFKVKDPEDPTCEDPEKPNPPICDPIEYPKLDDLDKCGLIDASDVSSPFSNCLKNHPEFVERYLYSCYFDVCANKDDDRAPCGALEALAAKCAMEGIVISWRTDTLCPMDCKGGSVYVKSGSACPKTCSLKRAPEICSLPDIETCECPGDKLWQDGTCISPDQCDATTTTSTTTTSTTTTPPTTTTTPTTTPPPTTTTTPPPTTTTTPPPTTTANAPPPPPPHPVSGTCRCYGDPHCTTIDGFHFNLSMASCGMTLLRDGCNGGIPSGSKNSYEVAVDIDSSGRRWFIEGVRVVTGGHTLEMGSTPLVVVVDGATVSQHSIKGSTEGSPVVIHGFKLYQTAPRRVMVVLSNGVHIEWNFNRRVKAQIPATQASHTCGICGNSDGNPNNDHVLGSDSRCPAKSQLPQTHQAGDLIGTSEADSLLYALSWYSYTRSGDTACSNSCQ